VRDAEDDLTCAPKDVPQRLTERPTGEKVEPRSGRGSTTSSTTRPGQRACGSLRVYAAALGARHVPVFVARMAAGPWAVFFATQARGASNEKAKRELGWTPRSWRDSFRTAFG
jgi:hypothetical protein